MSYSENFDLGLIADAIRLQMLGNPRP